tara:strand:- start:428 stop:649 length:222 start_codon:yes stop_codon:yes gene_type:complete
MKTATIETHSNGSTYNYKVKATDGNLLPLRFFSTTLEAWEYLTIYEEDNPERACQIYPYAKKYLNRYSELRIK